MALVFLFLCGGALVTGDCGILLREGCFKGVGGGIVLKEGRFERLRAKRDPLASNK